MTTHDIVVIGAGIAGTSVACELAGLGSVLLVERESVPGYHSTGRSAAVLTESYGVEAIRRLTVASRGFLASPPPEFSLHSLLHARPVLWVAHADQMPKLEATVAATQRLAPSIRLVDAEEARRHCPALRPDYVAGGQLEPDAMDIDVAGLHQGFLKTFRGRGGLFQANAEVVGITREGDAWTIESTCGKVSCGIVVNAAGAWCDTVARLAGAPAIGLTPKRRTAFVFDTQAGVVADGWPSVIDADEEFYFKPESGGILGSPADETPVPPCDVQPEMLDIALAIDRIQRATTLTVRRPRSQWAGLRTFAPDNTPVVGMEPEFPGFFLVGRTGWLWHHDRAGNGPGKRRIDRIRGPASRFARDRVVARRPCAGAPASRGLRSERSAGPTPASLARQPAIGRLLRPGAQRRDPSASRGASVFRGR